MSQKLIGSKPVKLVTDKNESQVNPDEATFLKNYRVSINKNQNNDAQEGGNFGVGTGYTSNQRAAVELLLPAGINTKVLDKEIVVLNQVYIGYWNSNGNHGIYRINGNDNTAEIVIVDSRLNFSDDPKHSIPEHRVSATILYNSTDENTRSIKEIIFQYTDAFNWQRWININACIGTGGFKTSYYKVHKPHFDFDEYIDYPFRPPMYPPSVVPVAPVPDDRGKSNNIPESVQFSIQYIFTDGRTTTLSPYSLPYIKSLTAVPGKLDSRCLDLTLYAGSGHVEKIKILVRSCGGEWKVYDTINKFSDCGVNDESIIQNKYWTRQNPWDDYQFDDEENTIVYRYCGDKECGIFSAEDAIRYQQDTPLLSTAINNIGDSVVLGNNKYGYNNLSCEVLDKIDLSVIEESGEGVCSPKNVTVKFFAYINRNEKVNQFIWRHGESAECYFGGMMENMSNDLEFVNTEGPTFNLRLGSKEGFLCYLSGTPYTAISKQYIVNINNSSKSFIGVINIDDAQQLQNAKDALNRGDYFIQEFEFRIPCGNYTARLSSHMSEVTDIYHEKSTYVQGMCNPIAQVYGGRRRTDTNLIYKPTKEFEFSVCDEDIDFWFDQSIRSTFLIFTPGALGFAKGHTPSFYNAAPLGRFIDGYLSEDVADKIPVELVKYQSNQGFVDYEYNGGWTDHNGFFFASSSRGDSNRSEIDFEAVHNCNDVRFLSTIGGSNRGFFPNRDVSIKQRMGNSYGPCNRVLIKGKVIESGTGLGIPGVGVTLKGTAVYYTDTEGNFTIIAHPFTYNSRQAFPIYFNSSTQRILMSSDCGKIPTENYDQPLPCISCDIREYNLVNPKILKFASGGTITSLKDGGRYGVYAAGLDLALRGTFANFVGYLDMPTIMDMGGIKPLKIGWNITGLLNLPKDIKYLSLLITNNLNNRRYLQWVGDGIVFLNRNGEETTDGNGAIFAKISIQSLFEYNNQNNFSTNTAYQFVSGDKVRIYDDGDGNYFPSSGEGGFMDYPVRGSNFNDVSTIDNPDETEDGKSIIIDYDTRLLQLKDSCGFWLEIMSPRECTDLELAYEVSVILPVIDGELVDGITSGELPAFDTYYINRGIVVKDCSGVSINHPFASSSISDFFGTNCNSYGRVLARNENAEQKWFPLDIIKSDNFINEGSVNGLGTFRERNRKQFKGQGRGGIVAIHSETAIIMFICENDWFTTNYDQEYVKITPTGILQANLEDNISNPNQKTGDSFGCSYEHTETIDFFEGICVWADIKNTALVFMDFKSIVDITVKGNKSWFINKFKYVEKFNKSIPQENYTSELIGISGKIDPQSKSYHLTFRPRRNKSVSLLDFVNNEREFFLDMQETMLFNLNQNEFIGTVGYAPEGYARLRDSITGVELIAFALSLPYFHNSVGVKTENEFFGIKTEQVIEVVFRGEESKDKLFQGVTLESRGLPYFIDRIVTSEKGVFSYLPIDYINKKTGAYHGAFLRDTNVYPSPEHPMESMLIDGGAITGLWAKIKFVRSMRELDKYNELDYIWVRHIDLEKSKK